ncbi:hypothetical protein [Bifidobacterium callitrichidarum]|uniref:Uncharacterized protein n=1 Tax=Bifidobacterium callitrichidarum TaxID=2052941 RepID=A0A2U2N464_9BIFI|nr:hypothetical protein [Bifidobacterium callitrichidarum]PWG64011.1 hypothetical protein DF196_09830 [Bifidobacterium callitrichidarum]
MNKAMQAMQALRNHTPVLNGSRGPERNPGRVVVNPNNSDNPDRRAARPLWWWLLAAFLAFAVIVTSAFVWQRSTRMTSQKIYDELVALDPNVTEAQLESDGYVYGGEAVAGWHGYSDGESYPWYFNPDQKRIDKFVDDVKAGRESVLKLVVRGTGPTQQADDAANGSSSYDSSGVSVRILWYDPNISADWAEKPSSLDPVTVHHDGKGQIREWWWRKGEVVVSDKRFSRGIEQTDDPNTAYVLKHQPSIPVGADDKQSTDTGSGQAGQTESGKSGKSGKSGQDDTIIMEYDEVLYALGG